MTTKRLVHLLVALGLVASAFAGMALPAGAQPPGPEVPGQNAIFYPYIPNGVDIEEGNGPWYGVITVQNLENLAVDLEFFNAAGDSVRTASLNPHASRTFSADLLGIEDKSAGAIYVTASFKSIGDAIDAGLCEESTFTVTRGPDANTSDVFDTGLDRVDRARVDGFTLNTDYTVSINGGVVTIDWSRAGAEPQTNSTYTLRVWVCPPPRIGGVEKHASVSLSSAGRTDKDTVAVTGYTALPLSDLALSRNLPADSTLDDVLGETGQWNWAFPIVQTNNGWNSVIHVTNFSGVDSCGITVTFYQSPSGSSDPSFGSFTTTLDAGEMVDVDLLKQGFPSTVNDWVGQAWVSADCAVAATVDRLKDETNMALTLIPQPRVDTGEYAKYGPLVYENFSGWNTGITFANLSDTETNTVTISFYNQAGQLVSSEQRVLQPRAVEYIYRPATANEELGGPVGSLQQVVVTGTAPLAAAADSVKYLSGREEGQALSYLLQGGAFQGETLSVPLIQKGTSLAPSGQFSGDTSGVQLFNASPTTPATVEYAFYDQTGALVAPTLTGPVVTTIGALSAATLYTPFFAEMPAGFQGAFLATVVSGGADAPVAAVSNNVNYDVVGDGTAVYNAFIAGARELQGASFSIGPTFATNPVTDENGDPVSHTVTVTVFDQFDNPFAGARVCFEVVSGPNTGAEDPSLSHPSPGVSCGLTDASGVVTFTYASNGTLGLDEILVKIDRDNDGFFEAERTVTKQWTLGLARLLACEPAEDANPAGTVHTVTCTLTDGAGNPVEGVPLSANIDPGPNSAVIPECGVTNADGQATCTYQGTGGPGMDTITITGDGASATVTKMWIIAEGTLALSPAGTVTVGDDTADGTATVTVTNTTDPVPVVLVITPSPALGSFTPCSSGTLLAAPGTTSGGATNTFTVNLYACAGSSGDTFDVAAYHDVNGNGAFDPGVDVQIGTTQTFTLP